MDRMNRMDIEHKLQTKKLDTEAILYAMMKDNNQICSDSLKIYALQLGIAKMLERYKE